MNIITKSGTKYYVTELKYAWKLTKTDSLVIVDYKIPKEICPTYEDLNSYVLKSNLF